MQALIFIEANGKAAAWSRIVRSLGMTAQVIPTGGHVCSFPDKLFPLGIDMRKEGKLEARRAPDPEKLRRIVDAVKAAPANAHIVLAMDNDVEGDVIAYDVAEIIFRSAPERVDAIYRVRPGPITAKGVRHAMSMAKPVRKCLGRMVNDAIPGRARAVTDRWIGAVFSRMANVAVGRVRSAILGAVYLNNRAPQFLRGRPEVGEITFQARSATGGRPFIARVPLSGTETPDHVQALIRLAKEWSGRQIPGSVRPLQSLSAAIAPRMGTVRPFNTADALAYASRHHGIPVKMAMQGLQDSYLRGLISYPRTDSHEISSESASRVTMLGFGCGLDGLEAEVLSSEGRISSLEQVALTHDNAHEALHPVVGISTKTTQQMRELIRKPLRKPPGGWDRDSVINAMTILVSRRAFEASREITLERGNWGIDNQAGIASDDAELLQDLEWFRDEGFNFPWTRNFLTSVKEWPLDAVLLETMVIEGIGRPSTYAAHVNVAVESEDIEFRDFPGLPKPTPQGKETLKKIPKSVWNPAVCRQIEDALENAGNLVREDISSPLQKRARHRVLFWLNKIPDDMRKPLLEALDEGRSSREKGVAANLRSQEPVADAERDDPSLSTDIPEPAPYG